MTDTAVPQTPAQVASAILEGIRSNPEQLNMNTWATLTTEQLAPHEGLCGSTLCAAGWAAHVTGWTIVSLPYGWADVTGHRQDGLEYTEAVDRYAQRGEERRLIWEVAQEALGLAEQDTFWGVSGEVAIRRLERIAAGLPLDWVPS